MTTRELLRAAASELFNCEATSDSNADAQLELARGLRAIADRFDAAIAHEKANAGVNEYHAGSADMLSLLDTGERGRLVAILSGPNKGPVETSVRCRGAGKIAVNVNGVHVMDRDCRGCPDCSCARCGVTPATYACATCGRQVCRPCARGKCDCRLARLDAPVTK